jgi:hypothetical protein
LNDYAQPQQSILGAFGSGLGTGLKANVNGLSSAVVSTVTIGYWDKVEPWAVTDLDRSYGYDVAFGIANASGNLLVTAGTCGASKWAQGAGATGRAVTTGLRVMDFGSNVVGGGRNIYDIAEEGPNFCNVTGLISNGVCIGIHVKTFRDGMKVRYDSPKPWYDEIDPPINKHRQVLHTNGTPGKSQFQPDIDVEEIVHDAWANGKPVFNKNGEFINKVKEYPFQVGTVPGQNSIKVSYRNKPPSIHGWPSSIPEPLQ